MRAGRFQRSGKAHLALAVAATIASVASIALPVRAAEPPAVDPEMQRITEAVDRRAVLDRAVRELIELSQGPNPALRSNAIEAMQQLPERALPTTQRGLEDPNPAVRFAAVVSAGQLEFKSLVPAIRPLVRDPNRSVRAAAIYALHRLGEEIDLTPLAGMLRSQDPGLRSNVALLMGLMGDASAIPMLKQAAAAPMPKVSGARAAIVRCQIAEAVVRLGDNSELNTLRASAYSTYGEVRVISINAMGAVGDERMIPALKAFLREADDPREGRAREPVEVRLAAAAALARMDEHAGLSTALRFSRDANPVVRAQAAWGLGWFEGEDRAFARLRALLDDEAPMVRVAAAASVVRQAD